MSEGEVDIWAKLLVPHSELAQNSKITHAGWKHIPSTYLVCETDEMMPLPVQKMFIQHAKDVGIDVGEEICSGGHSPYISMPKVVADVVLRSAA
jgi:hypothetical protein